MSDTCVFPAPQGVGFHSGPTPSLDELQSFVVVADERHFGRAAKRLGVSQPALSKRLQRLEESVGGSLLVRGHGNVSLTEPGRVLLERTKTLLVDIDRAISISRQALIGEAGRLRIGCGVASVAELLPKAISRFRRSHPAVQIELRDMVSAAQLQSLRAEEIDLGFVRLPFVDPTLVAVPVVHQRLDAVTPLDFPWPPRTGLRSLANAPFAVCSRAVSSGYYDHVLSLCRLAGFSPQVVSEINDLYSLLQLVRAGVGVALVPVAMAAMRVPGIRFRRIAMPEAAWDIAIVWRKRSTNPVIDGFVATVRAIYEEGGGRRHRAPGRKTVGTNASTRPPG